MNISALSNAANVLADPSAYADDRRLHTALSHLRAYAPVAFVDVAPYRPFWAVTKHADILAIERNPALWVNNPRPLLNTAELDDQLRAQVEAGMGLQTLAHLDDPRHRQLRAVGADWFRPKVMRALKIRVDELAKIYVDKLRDARGECDFVQEVALRYPLYVILSLLGLPESDFPRMLMLTQELFGGDDVEYQRGRAQDERVEVVGDFFDYFNRLTASRRRHPTEDLASAIANAQIDGESLSAMDTASYYLIIATAGHDTTSATIAGGLHALIENPQELRRLREHPELLPTAVEEMIRWVTPVKEFMRTATEDTTVRGVPIASGESVYLAYVSGNRDEEVFDEPFRFDVGRNPNKHLAFGHGIHFCLGAALARMEISSFYSELLPRLEHIELAGEPQLAATTFVGGLKHLPVRCELR